MKNKVIINASAAKSGGALTILETFLNSIPEHTKHLYVVIAPRDFSYLGFKSEKITTSGIKSLLFSIIGIAFFQMKYGTKKVISFNNVNSIFFSKHTVTYFHQLKMFDYNYKDFKLKVYRFVIKYLNSNTTFVVQSELVKHKFLNFDNRFKNQIIVAWPGFKKADPTQDDLISFKDLPVFSARKPFGLVPISYNSEHKNMSSLIQLDGFLVEHSESLIFLTQDDSFKKLRSVVQIGAISRSQLFALYELADYIIFPSKVETIGLPIFEFLQTGKPAFVYAADYAVSLREKFGNPENFILYKNNEEFKALFLQKKETRATHFDYSKGEWNKVIEIL